MVDGHCATVTPAPATMLFSDSCVLVAVRHLSTHFVASWNEGIPDDVYGLTRRPVLVPGAGVMVAVCRPLPDWRPVHSVGRNSSGVSFYCSVCSRWSLHGLALRFSLCGSAWSHPELGRVTA